MPRKTENAPVSPESIGAEVDEKEQSETSAPESTPSTGDDGGASSKPSTTSETPAMKALKDKMEAKAAAEPERPPHPYKWSIAAPGMIPFGFRDPATGEPSRERIEAHVADCWRAETIPDIAGVLVTLPKQD
jgi:hypothetical protein